MSENKHTPEPVALTHAAWLDKSLTIGAREAASELRRLHEVEKQRDELMAENKQLRKDAERYRVLRYSEYQLDEDDPSVSDSLFNEYFGKELDSAVDELKSRFDSAIASVKGQK